MAKRTNWVAWVLVVMLAAVVLTVSGTRTPYLRVYWSPEAWDAFIDAAQRNNHHYMVYMLAIAVTGLSFLGVDLWRTLRSWTKLPPAEQARRYGGLFATAVVLLILLLWKTRLL
jgi:hypothetical protein